LREPNNPLDAAPDVLRNAVGAGQAPIVELRSGLEAVISDYISGPSGDLRLLEPEVDVPRLLLAASLNVWPTTVPARLQQGVKGENDPASKSLSIEDLNWGKRAERLSKSGLLGGHPSVKQVNKTSDDALMKFAEYALGQQPAPTRNSFSVALHTLVLDDDRTIGVYVVEPHGAGTPAISWSDFGKGIDQLSAQIRAHEADFDLTVGVNEAGLAMAALLSKTRESRPALGYLRTKGLGIGKHKVQEDASILPSSSESMDAVLLCDFEAKQGNAVAIVSAYLRSAIPGLKRIYFAVMGALASEEGPLLGGDPLCFDDLECSTFIQEADVDAVFIAAVMAGSIDPPNRSR
jgi:hypothetical protein